MILHSFLPNHLSLSGAVSIWHVLQKEWMIGTIVENISGSQVQILRVETGNNSFYKGTSLGPWNPEKS